MAIQTENGYTKMANEIFDVLAQVELTGHEWRILLIVFRKTYGFNKKADSISFGQFSDLTGINRRAIIRSVKSLLLKNILHSVKNDTNGINSYSFNKHFPEWRVVTRMTLSKKSGSDRGDTTCEVLPTTTSVESVLPKGKTGRGVVTPVVKGSDILGKRVVSPASPTKDSITKDNIQKTGDALPKPMEKKTVALKKPSFDFEAVWATYPRRMGKKAAEAHFRASVLNLEDLANIKKAIANYCRQIRERNTETEYIKHGSTFFNNWRDYVDLYENERDPQTLKDLARLEQVLGRKPFPQGVDGSIGAVLPADTPELRAARERSDLVMKLSSAVRAISKTDPDRAWWMSYVSALISPAEKDKSPEKLYDELVALGGAPKINLLATMGTK